jgi:predicted ATP-grasp superfamily ATP-dependent carboligase
MKIFVYEHFTGGGLGAEPLPASLAHEGDLIVQALLKDLASVPGVELLVSRDRRLPPVAQGELLVPLPGEAPLALYARGVAAADAAWPTAPESRGTLERLARETLRLGRTLLGCRPDAVQLTTSKRATASALRAAGIATVPTFGRTDLIDARPGPWVVKPDDAAGCEETLVVPDWRAASQYLAQSPGMVAQPWVEGVAASLSLLCAGGNAVLLCCNRQHLRVAEGRLALERIGVNAIPDPTGHLAALGVRIAATIPGLWGYVGVDLVLGTEGPVVLEINPRLTTSYCGLRPALGINVAARVLDLLRTGDHLGHAPLPRGAPVEIALETLHAG